MLPLRNFFLLPHNYSGCKSVLVQRFGALLRKAWNPLQFKGQVRGSTTYMERLGLQSSFTVGRVNCPLA